MKNQGRKGVYDNVKDEKRMLLVSLVVNKGKKLVQASKLLKINYSTAKTIMRIFRKEKRMIKKVPKPVQQRTFQSPCSGNTPLQRKNPQEVIEELNYYFNAKCYLMNQICRYDLVIRLLNTMYYVSMYLSLGVKSTSLLIICAIDL
jgi:hypothetical protein